VPPELQVPPAPRHPPPPPQAEEPGGEEAIEASGPGDRIEASGPGRDSVSCAGPGHAPPPGPGIPPPGPEVPPPEVPPPEVPCPEASIARATTALRHLATLPPPSGEQLRARRAKYSTFDRRRGVEPRGLPSSLR
jgi:hypothetical protein